MVFFHGSGLSYRSDDASLVCDFSVWWECFWDARGDVLSISASSLRPEGTSVSSSGLDSMSVQSWSLSVSGKGKTPGADQARRLTSSTEADWGGRSLGGPGHGGTLGLLIFLFDKRTPDIKDCTSGSIG